MKKIEYWGVCGVVIIVGLSAPFIYNGYVEHSAMSAVIRSIDGANKTGISNEILSEAQINLEVPPIRGPEETKRWKEKLESLGMWPEPEVRRIKNDGDLFSHDDPADAKRYAAWLRELRKRAAQASNNIGTSQ
ncbi:MAG: hypothetical protein ACXWJZ_12500 [Burkholderiaceae bacterium]